MPDTITFWWRDKSSCLCPVQLSPTHILPALYIVFHGGVVRCSWPREAPPGSSTCLTLYTILTYGACLQDWIFKNLIPTLPLTTYDLNATNPIHTCKFVLFTVLCQQHLCGKSGEDMVAPDQSSGRYRSLCKNISWIYIDCIAASIWSINVRMILESLKVTSLLLLQC